MTGRRGSLRKHGRVALAGNYIPLGHSAPKLDFGLLSRHAPALAGDLVFGRFCVPRFSEYRTADHATLVARARHHLRGANMTRQMTHVGEVATFELLPDGDEICGSILVVHGWTSESSFMMGLAEPLRRSGFRVVLVDCPAHGRSRGDRTNLIDCAHAIVCVADRFGSFDGILAHSMGALAAVMAGAGPGPLPHPVSFSRYCLISAPNNFSGVTERFAKRIGISVAARRQFERQFERVARMPLREYRTDRFLRIVRKRTLVMHSRDDHEVSFHNAVEMTESCEDATLCAFEGLGHRRILYAPPVVRAVVRYFRGA